VSPKATDIKGLLPSIVLFGDDEAFKKYDLVRGLQIIVHVLLKGRRAPTGAEVA
jgi:hypothetical protein